VSQIKEQLEAIGDTIEEVDLVMTTLNGIPKSWESFIHGISSRRKLTMFNRLREDCTQEEARLAAREENLGNDDQALATHARKGKRRKEKERGSSPQEISKVTEVSKDSKILFDTHPLRQLRFSFSFCIFFEEQNP
jgi:hypothetical protein